MKATIGMLKKLSTVPRRINRSLKNNSEINKIRPENQPEIKNSTSETPTDPEKVLINGKWISRKTVAFDVEPVHANTNYLYQPLFLSKDWPEKIPLSERVHGIWGYGLLFAPLSRFLKTIFMDFKTFGEHKQLQAAVSIDPLERRHKIFTVPNHIANIDDPTLISLLYKYPECYFKSDHLPWSIAGHNILFVKKFHNWFFQQGRASPIMRGQGIHQPGFEFLLDRLKKERGFFMNIYAEGKVNMFRDDIPLKWGLAKFLQDEVTMKSQLDENSLEKYRAPTTRIIWHEGMCDFMSPFRQDDKKFPYFPDISKHIFKGNRHEVSVNVGRALDFSLLIETMRKRRETDSSLVKFVARSEHMYSEDEEAECEERQVVMDLVKMEMDFMKKVTQKIHEDRKSANLDEK